MIDILGIALQLWSGELIQENKWISNTEKKKPSKHLAFSMDLAGVEPAKAQKQRSLILSDISQKAHKIRFFQYNDSFALDTKVTFYF